MAGRTSRKVTCDGALAKLKIDLRLAKVPAACGLRWLARLTKAGAYELEDKSILITRTAPKGGTKLVYRVDDDSEEWKKEIEKALKKKVSLEFVETPLVEALSFFQGLTGINMVVDPVIKGENKPITLKMTGASIPLALTWLLKLGSAEYELLDHALLVRPGGAGKPAEVKSTAALPPTGISRELKAKLAKTLSLTVTDKPVTEWINYLREIGDVKIILDPRAFGAGKTAPAGRLDPKTPINLRGKDVTLRAVIEKTAAQLGLRVQYLKGNVVYLTLPAGKGPGGPRTGPAKPATGAKKEPEVF
jgi:hypothetical protein